MFHPVSFFIGLRYSRSRQRTGFVSFITFFSISGILLGVTALIAVVSVMNGFEGELKKRILAIVPHVLVEVPKDDTSNWQQTKKDLSQLEFVQNISPIVEAESLVLSNNALQGVLIQGIEPEQEQHNLVFQHMLNGQLNSLSTTAYQVIIGQSLARKLDVSQGDKIRVVVPAKTIFTPMGRIPVQRIFTIAGIFNMGSQVDDSVIYMHKNDANKLLRVKDDEVSHLRLYLQDAFLAEQVVEKIHQQFPSLTARSWQTSQGTLFSAVKMEKNMIWLMLSLIVAVAAFNIVSALVMVVIDKQGEIAILQTCGMDRAGIVKIFIAQGVINGFWGVALGSFFGVLLALNLNDIMSVLGVNLLGGGYATQSLPVDLQWLDVLTVSGSALLMSFLATLYPAYRASLTQPAEVLSHE
ncbi:lipoprotein-releasing ABC transporter permease subunit [Thalassotalea marina]|nr:lipoprotein-releasing ABC transporter permease subunit [Thalassotalea marina]